MQPTYSKVLGTAQQFPVKYALCNKNTALKKGSTVAKIMASLG
jgi:hypothetical protein